MSFYNCTSSERRQGLERDFWLNLWALILGSGAFCQVAACELCGSSHSCIFSLCLVFLYLISVVSNYWKVSSDLKAYSASWQVSWNQISKSKLRRGLSLGGGESSRMGFWRFSICEWAQCAAAAVANTLALKSELKLSLKPEGGKYCLFSETLSIHMVVGCPVLIAKAAVPIREDTEAIRSRLASLPGRSQDHNGIDHTDTWGSADCYVSRKHKQFPWLINILPTWMVCHVFICICKAHLFYYMLMLQ